MWKQRVNAGYVLLWVLLVNFIAGLAVLFRNRKDAQSGDRFEGIGGFRMKHSDSNGEVVAEIEYGKHSGRTDKNAFGKNAWRNHTT